ncbi:MAG: DotD/TraH family lipoprotein [Gammaproteobacteria bacterium]
MQKSKRHNIYLRLALLLAPVLSLNACTIVRDHFGKQAKSSNTLSLNDGSAQGIGSSKTKSSAANPALEKELLQTAQSIEKSLSTLAAAQDYKSPPLVNTAPLLTPEAGLAHTADVDWTGPVGALLERIAEVSRYRFKALGKEPPIPVLVSINAKQLPMADIIQNASLQVGRRAQIMVFAKERVIELRYLNPT